MEGISQNCLPEYVLTDDFEGRFLPVSEICGPMDVQTPYGQKAGRKIADKAQN